MPIWANSAPSTEWRRGQWKDVSSLIKGQPLVLLIPAHDVLLTHTTLATSNARQLRQALPYALEEQLIGELEEQHFVWNDSKAGELNVAVIERPRLKQWLELLKQHKLRAKAILPDLFILPISENIPTIWHRGGQVFVRTGPLSGFSCPEDMAPLLIDNAFPEDAGEDERKARFYADTDDADWHDSFTQVAESQPDRLLRQSIQEGLPLNLMQGYQDESMSTFARQWKRWRTAAVFALITLGIMAGLEGVQVWNLKQRLAQAEADNLTQFQAIFPDITGVTAVDIRSRVMSEIKRLEQSRGQGGDSFSPLPQMGIVARVFQQTGSLKVTEIRKSRDQLIIAFEAPGIEQVEQLKQILVQQLGFEPDMKSTQTGATFKAELALKQGVQS